jgi:SOS-response transcriptional repressor LexA
MRQPRHTKRKRVFGLCADLTDREYAVLTYAAGCIDGTGVQPTYRMMQQRLGFKSTNSIMGIIDGLLAKGVIWQTSGHGFAFDWKAYLQT